MLSDWELRKAISENWIGWSPYDDALINPNSIDVRLSHQFLIPNPGVKTIDTNGVPAGHMLPIDGPFFVLSPREFVLASTTEKIRIPNDLVAMVEGKSSLGRLGLVVHVTAGFIDSGFEGQITLELVNHAPWDIVLHAGMRIAQVAFASCLPVQQRYHGRYQNQFGPQESKYGRY